MTWKEWVGVAVLSAITAAAIYWLPRAEAWVALGSIIAVGAHLVGQ